MAMCPVECIAIEFNAYKELVATVEGTRCIECGRCLLVCPDTPPYTDRTLKASPGDTVSILLHLIGPIVGAYIGYATDQEARWGSSSGGLVTQVLEELFRRGEIDSATVVLPSEYTRTGRFFEAKVATTVEEIRASRGSKYYPVEFSKVLKEISRQQRRCAIVALPCAAEAIRKAQRVNPGLRDNIRFLLALACGHNVSAAYTEYLLLQHRIDPRSVCGLSYRDKEGSKSADDFNLRIEFLNANGNIQTRWLSFHSSIVGKTWSNYLFALNKCLFCPDFAGEYADAAFADAWLPEYSADVRGTSFILTRQEHLDAIVNQMAQDSRVKLSPVEPAQFLKAHQRRFLQKQDLLRSRVRWLKLLDKDAPDYG
ncbi:MAG: Coenzyme F420 hydrogenase/dehydrogenase, beta subunit C-terminal domain, partial [Firmicutes bacterium]|nr:Coenzyme F420 hydrogenase/dehydrogenase, beta subunit C-terminal domain [Bacillota bacterium]